VAVSRRVVAGTRRLVAVSWRLVAGTRRLVAVSWRLLAVSRRVVAVSRRVVAVSRRVVAVSRRVLAVSRRVVAVSRRASDHPRPFGPGAAWYTTRVTLAASYQAHLDTLQRGYEAALATTGYDAVVLCSGTPASKNRFDDQAWPLSPTPAFTHWCPLSEADAFVVVRPGRRAALVRTIVDDFWETIAPPESDHFWAGFEVEEVAAGRARDRIPSGKVSVVTRDPDAGALGGDVNPPALIAALDALRTRKTAYEIACQVEATRRGVRGHRAAAARFATGEPVSELELHLAFLAGSGQDDAWTPYKGIVALGPHASVLHYVAYETKPIAGDTSLLVDAGARYLGYGSDITRCYTRGDTPAAKRFTALVARMDAVQQAICSRVRPGQPYEDLHDESHRLIAAALLDAGICKGSAAEVVDRGVTRALFPHGLGHSLGVVTHDVGMKPRAPRADNPYLRNTSTIEVGQVFTIEPGVYFIDALLAPLRGDDRARLVDWASIDELRRFGGIRIEDNVVVQDRGVRNLTREAYA
jgi:Xaa-Pro dipeptidase